MEVMISNGLRYSIEFIKILLAVHILNIRVKKQINLLFAASFVGVVIISNWYDISKNSVLYVPIIVGIFLITLYKKKEIGFIVLSYVWISIVDMIVGIIYVNIFDIDAEQLMNDFMMVPIVNSCSIVMLIIIYFIRVNKRKKSMEHKLDKNYPIIIIGGIVLSLYLTYVLLINMGEFYVEYQKGLAVSAIIISLIYLIICVIIMKNQRKNIVLKMENEMNQKLLKVQSEYYDMRLKKETETKRFRHDIKGHIMCIQMLYEQKKYDELGEYLKQMQEYTGDLSYSIVTGNSYIDMILSDLAEEFPDVEIKWDGKLPALSMESMDVCTLFYNLLKNAFEAAGGVADKSVNFSIKTQKTNMMINVFNRYDTIKEDGKAGYASTKSEKGHGYGLGNIKRCVDKYSGSYTVTTCDNVFCTEIILADVISENLW